MSIFENKAVLIISGTGPFGRKFTEILLNEYNPKKITICSRRKLLQIEIRNYFQDSMIRFLIGDINGKDSVYRAMNNVDIIVNAVVLKQVTACEYNSIEAVKTNIDASLNMIVAAIDNSVERAMAISTDKEVNPVNLYGATTKMVTEDVFNRIIAPPLFPKMSGKEGKVVIAGG